MQKDEFYVYWNNYILIEKEFLNTVQYVALDSINYKSYSNAYQKLILEIGSELDNVFKLICSISGYKYNNIGGYYKLINLLYSQIINQEVNLFEGEIKKLTPFKNWSSSSYPKWWTIYNKIKHERHEKCKISSFGSEKYYKYANLSNCINLLAGLYICEMYANKIITNSYSPIQPISRIFFLDSNGWSEEEFSFGMTGILNGSSLTITSINKSY